MADTSRMSVTLTNPQLAFLEKEAKRLGITVADTIRRIVDQHRESDAILRAAEELMGVKKSKQGITK